MSRIAIAIDGPASSGKGTVARMVAEALHYDHVDTGAMYRAVAFLAAREGLLWENQEIIGEFAAKLEFRFPLRNGALRVVVNGEDLTGQIRGEEVGKGASVVAAIPEVRRSLLETQRELGRQGGVVMDGRDIGTVVLPEAGLKVYLDAALEERARRRAVETNRPYADVLPELAERDARDMNRATAPLRCADDAVRVDTTGLGIGTVVEQIL